MTYNFTTFPLSISQFNTPICEVFKGQLCQVSQFVFE